MPIYRSYKYTIIKLNRNKHCTVYITYTVYYSIIFAKITLQKNYSLNVRHIFTHSMWMDSRGQRENRDLNRLKTKIFTQRAVCEFGRKRNSDRNHCSMGSCRVCHLLETFNVCTSDYSSLPYTMSAFSISELKGSVLMTVDFKQLSLVTIFTLPPKKLYRILESLNDTTWNAALLFYDDVLRPPNMFPSVSPTTRTMFFCALTPLSKVIKLSLSFPQSFARINQQLNRWKKQTQCFTQHIFL